MIKEKDDVLIIAQAKQKKYPVITYRKYGKGHILIIIKSFCGGVLNQWVSGSVGQLGDWQAQLGNPLTMMPRPNPETNENQHKRFAQHIGSPRRGALAAGGIVELLLNAITRFSQDIYTSSDLTRLLPLELSLKNESSEAKTLTVKTFLPYGVEAFGFEPEPGEGEELNWTITIPAVSTETVSYWIKLPDQVNSFEIKTELYDEDTKLNEVSTTFEVIQTVLYRINELILELDMVGASGKDSQLVRKAKHHLEKIRNRTVNSFIDHLLNLHDSIKAASYLGEVKSVDISAQRIKVQDIMVILGRRFYETVKTWGEAQLSPILEIIAK